MASDFEAYIKRYLNDDNILFSSDQIENLALEAENLIAESVKLVVKRAAPATTINVPSVTLPSDLVTLRRVTWKGYEIRIINQTDYFRDYEAYVLNASGSPHSGTSSRPTECLISPDDLTKLQLIPTPNETISAGTTNLWDTAIGSKLIIEYYALPDLTVAALRGYYKFVRLVVRDYVCFRCFSAKGDGQQLKLALFYKTAFSFKLDLLRTLTSKVFVAHGAGGLHQQTRKDIYSRYPASYGPEV